VKILGCILLIFAGLNCFGATRASVAELSSSISSAQSAHQSDKEIARRITSIELTERLTESTLATLLRQGLGAQTTDALQLLVDESSFLDPPASELPDSAPPTSEEKKELVGRADDYTLHYLKKLPNFLCTLVIRRFDNGNALKRVQLRDTVSGELSFDLVKGSDAVQAVNGILDAGHGQSQGMTGHGEFGGLLAQIFFGGSHAQAVWSHWELVEGKRVAVFNYSIEKAHASYTVSYCCQPNLIKVETASKGQLSIDPSSGAILRMTEQAVDIPLLFPVHNAGIMVEYRAVDIGGKSYLLPIRGISVADMKWNAMALELAGIPTILSNAYDSERQYDEVHSLNEVHFTNYHKFEAESRLLTSEARPNAPPAQTKPFPHPFPAVAAISPELSRPPVDAMLTAEQPPNLGQVLTPMNVAISIPQGPLVTATAKVTQNDGPRPAPDVTFRVAINVVTVPVVVRDRDGHPVDNLKKDDFELLDAGIPQVISRFIVERPLSEGQGQGSNTRTQVDHTGTPATAPLPDRYVVYMFDDLHLEFGDLSRAKEAAQRQLQKSADPAPRIAVFSTSGLTMLDFTDDRPKVEQAIKKIRPALLSSTNLGATCPPEVSYYLGDQIINKANRDAFTFVVSEEAACQYKSPELRARTDARTALDDGDRDTRLALDNLQAAVRRMSMMAGQRTIVLVSPGFITLSLLPELDEVIERAARNGILINTLDARGVYVIAGDEIEGPAPVTSSVPGGPSPAQVSLQREQYARDEQNSLSNVLVALASGSGGSFSENSNDLYAGFHRLAGTPAVSYLLEFAPQNLKADGSYHKLEVKVKQRTKLIVQARKGYYAPKRELDPAEKVKEEIKNAVFSRDEIQEIPTILEVQSPGTGTADVSKLLVLAHLDLKPIRFQNQSGHSHSSLTAVFSLFDSNGKYIHGQQNKIELDYPGETLAVKLASGINIKSEFDAKAGHYFVRLVVRDENGQMSATTKAADVP
jgi:VWFA-related protein